MPLLLLACPILLAGCADDVATTAAPEPTPAGILAATFGDAIDLDKLDNYANQPVPAHVQRDNTTDNPITDTGATLGRVLFHDTLLSSDGTVACATCHKQELAFTDDERASIGVNGVTERHSMRLVNIRFGDESNVFWDERAASVEEQAGQPIVDHVEMGFSGEDGAPDLAECLERLAATDYYPLLFTAAFGDAEVTLERVGRALAQFVRSIQSFDSRYDQGRALVPSDFLPFPNFTAQEGQGKGLFMDPPVFIIQGVRTGGGLGCAGCHVPPEFNIDPASLNNGLTGTIAGTGTDLGVTRAPSLRDVVQADGTPNGGLMHTGDLDLDAVFDHYNEMTSTGNPNLDPRLLPGGSPQRLGLTAANREALKAFLRTLAGSNVYTDPKWSDPFLRDES